MMPSAMSEVHGQAEIAKQTRSRVPLDSLRGKLRYSASDFCCLGNILMPYFEGDFATTVFCGKLRLSVLHSNRQCCVHPARGWNIVGHVCPGSKRGNIGGTGT